MNIHHIEKQILNVIVKDQIPVGAAIPSIRNLQDRLDISRSAASNALRALCDKGILTKGDSTRSGFLLKELLPLEVENASPEKRILYLLPFDSSSYVTNQLLLTFENQFSQNNTGIYFNNTKNSIDEETRLLKSIYNGTHPHDPSALILSTCKSRANPNIELLKGIQQKIPIVLVDRRIEGFQANYVGTNNICTGYTAVDTLQRAGHRNIAFVSGLQNISPIYDRYFGFCLAMRTVGENNPMVFWLQDGESGSVLDIQKVISTIGQQILASDPRPTAIVCGFDRIAVALAYYFMSVGIRVPEDISLIGCDNDSTVLDMLPIPLSTFRHPYDTISSTATAIIDGFSDESQSISLYSDYVAGDSIKPIL